MKLTRLSDCFYLNEVLWKVSGLWPGRASSKRYKYFSYPFLFIFFYVYNVLLTFNLMYAPRILELLIEEVIFYFTEVTVGGKLLMIIFKRKKILEFFDLLDCDYFKGDNSDTRNITEGDAKKYVTAWKSYCVFSHIAWSCKILLPIIVTLIAGKKLELPICLYFFLTDETRKNHFTFFYFYQSFGMYVHMIYNVAIDSFIGGLIYVCITQLKVINYKIRNLDLTPVEKKESKKKRDEILMSKLNECLKHYDLILKFYDVIQDILSVAIFIQFGIGTGIICVILSALTLSSSTLVAFLVPYLIAMTGEIFVPSYFGTHLSYQSEQLAFAAYDSKWMQSEENFKRSLILFVIRTHTPLVVKGMKMFPLALGTFISIMKTAYSFFTLLRNMQDRQNV